MRSMQFGFYDNLIKTVVESYSGYVQIHANGYWEKQSLDNSMEVDDTLINTITSIPGVENVVQRVQTFSLVSKDEKSKGAIINGIDINQEQLITDWNKRIVKGSLYLSHNDEVLLGLGFFELNSKGFPIQKEFQFDEDTPGGAAGRGRGTGKVKGSFYGNRSVGGAL